MHAIDQPAAGDLQRRVGPAERREHHAELHRVQAELGGDARRGDREVAAVEVVDHHGNEQQRHDQETAAGGYHHGSRRGRRRRSGEGHIGFRHCSAAGYRCRCSWGKSRTTGFNPTRRSALRCVSSPNCRCAIGATPAAAQAAEAVGFDALMTIELGHDVFAPLGFAALATQRAELTPSIAVAFPRSPTITASQAWDLHANSGGRFVLGLGSQVRGHNERRFGIPSSRRRHGCATISVPCGQSGAPGKHAGGLTITARPTPSR